MSLDLTLLPMRVGDFINFSHTMLSLQTNSSDLFDAIQRILDMPNSQLYIEGLELNTAYHIKGEVAGDFTCYLARDPATEESCYGQVTEDAYGKKLQWVSARALSDIDPELVKGTLNQPAWAYLKTLPYNSKVVLYWS